MRNFFICHPGYLGGSTLPRPSHYQIGSPDMCLSCPFALGFCSECLLRRGGTRRNFLICHREFENNYFTEMCSGSGAGSYLRLIDFVYHSTLGLRVIKKKKISWWVNTTSVELFWSMGGRSNFFFFFTLFTEPRSLHLNLSDTRVYEPQIRAQLGTTAHFYLGRVVLEYEWTLQWRQPNSGIPTTLRYCYFVVLFTTAVERIRRLSCLILALSGSLVLAESYLGLSRTG